MHFLLSGLAVHPCLAKYGGGIGTAQQPYLIYTAEQMNQIGLDSNDWSMHFALMSDIDLSIYADEQFNLIGSASVPFSGMFDGRGHVISGFTYQGNKVVFEVGLFRVVGGEEAAVKNLGLINPNVSGSVIVGALAALLDNSTIENCRVTGGSVTAGAWRAGGLAGQISAGTVLNCYTSDTSINCTTWAGGLAGVNTDGLIINSYSANPVFVTPGSLYVGAFVGQGEGGTYSGCFYDNQVNPSLTGLGDGNDPYGLTGETTANLKLGITFVDAGWDIVTADNQPVRNVWRMCEDGINYPHLSIEYLNADFACPDGIDLYDLAVFSDDWMLEPLAADVDFNLDRSVNFRDWAILAAAWKSQRGSDNYNPVVDIAPAWGDGVIDEKDVALFAGSWLGHGSAYLNADIEPYGGDGAVDFADFAAFANQRVEGK